MKFKDAQLYHHNTLRDKLAGKLWCDAPEVCANKVGLSNRVPMFLHIVMNDPIPSFSIEEGPIKDIDGRVKLFKALDYTVSKAELPLIEGVDPTVNIWAQAFFHIGINYQYQFNLPIIRDELRWVKQTRSSAGTEAFETYVEELHARRD